MNRCESSSGISRDLAKRGAAPLGESEIDYLIVGAGAMGMAFADEILRGSRDARVVMVDRRAKPGGHWNDAYPFVTLHQPALFYGVNSRELGSGGDDLVSRAQILAYYEVALAGFEETGRFEFLSQHEYRAEGANGVGGIVRSLISGEPDRAVTPQKVVDATYMDVQVPATTPPQYAYSEGVQLVPINGLATLDRAYARYVVLGAGKTGIDAGLYLLGQNVSPDKISWVMPNDAWFLNRANIQPPNLANEFIDQMRLMHKSDSLESILDELERLDRLLRLDPEVRPTKYRCATVTHSELDALRTIGDVIRLGRVSRIEGATLHLADGERSFQEPPEEILYVDCTADGLSPRPEMPIFAGDRITLQSISMCQQVMSAAAIAAIELRFDHDTEKNAIASPVPHPAVPNDYLTAFARTMENQKQLGDHLFWWTMTSRLSGAKHMPLLDFVRFIIAALRWPALDDARIAALEGSE